MRRTLSKQIFFYNLFDRSDRTVRNDLQKLRKAGLATKEGQSKHRIVVENLPTALDTIENSSVSGD
ncbi:DeoR family transcriptional regulator [Halogeometricum sp. CBA1124]|nr:DeoR family transcriptional regulator [Halogeometricum sp. CBA1124]